MASRNKQRSHICLSFNQVYLLTKLFPLLLSTLFQLNGMAELKINIIILYTIKF